MASAKVVSSATPKVSDNVPLFDGHLHIELNFNGIERFNSQYTAAQIWLDQAVLRDSTPYVPFLNGILYKSGETGTTLGEGIVQWVAPYARYIYYGNVMVDAVTGKGPMHYIDKFGNEIIRFRKGAKLRPTSEKLKISKANHPMAQSFWFEGAKSQNKSIWVRNVRRIAGGG